MSIFDTLFGSSKPANTQANPTANPADPSGNPTPPTQGQEPKKEESPIDSFKGMWETDPNAPKVEPVKFVDIDPTKFQEQVSKLDFAKLIKPEQLSAISKGGDEAVKAFAESMNAISQASVAQSASIAKKMVEDAMGKADGVVQSKINSNIRLSQIHQLREAENPIFSHPATKPIVDAIEYQLTQQHPTATPQQISEMSKTYLTQFASLAAGPAKVESNPNGRTEMDWTEFLPASEF